MPRRSPACHRRARGAFGRRGRARRAERGRSGARGGGRVSTPSSRSWPPRCARRLRARGRFGVGAQLPRRHRVRPRGARAATGAVPAAHRAAPLVRAAHGGRVRTARRRCRNRLARGRFGRAHEGHPTGARGSGRSPGEGRRRARRGARRCRAGVRARGDGRHGEARDGRCRARVRSERLDRASWTAAGPSSFEFRYRPAAACSRARSRASRPAAR